MSEYYEFQFDERTDLFLNRGLMLVSVADKASKLVDVLKQEAEKSLTVNNDHLHATVDRINELPRDDTVETGSSLLVGSGEILYVESESDEDEGSIELTRFAMSKSHVVTGDLCRTEIQYLMASPDAQNTNELLPTICYVLDNCKLLDVPSGDTIGVINQETILPINLFRPTDVQQVLDIRPSLS